MNDEPNGLCHISEVLDYILNHERSSKTDREGGDGKKDRPTPRFECRS